MDKKEYQRQWSKDNIERKREHNRRWMAANPDKMRNKDLRRKYGITLDIFNAMLAAQNNKCAICTSEFTEKNKPHVDHCHTTQRVRGLLCGSCNRAMGLLKESIEVSRNLIAYLEKYKLGD